MKRIIYKVDIEAPNRLTAPYAYKIPQPTPVPVRDFMGLSVQEISDRYGPQAAQDAYTSDVLFGTDNKAISEQTFKFKYVVTIAVETMPIEADPGNLILKISLIAFTGQ